MRMPKDLSPEEQKVVANAQMGEAAILSEPTPEQLADPAFAMPVVRAAVIRALCLGEWEEVRLHAKGVQIVGVCIPEPLDFEFTILLCPLALCRCRLNNIIILRQATAKAINLSKSHAIKGFTADGADIKGNVFLTKGFTAKGEVRLLGASIGGDLSLTGASLENSNGFALSADRADIKGGVFLTKDFTAKGEVCLLNASIGGNLYLDSARLENPDGSALNAEGVNVKGSMVLREGFTAKGQVHLAGSSIGSSLIMVKAVLNSSSQTAISLESATIGRLLYLQETHITGLMDLNHCRIRQLADDKKSWPAAGDFYLNGFVYDSFGHNAPCTAAARLDWLRRQRHAGAFQPQPYEQVIRVFRTMGYDTEARKVAIAKQNDQRTYGQLGWSRWLLSWLLNILVAHGYKPERGLIYIGVLIVIGTCFFWWASLNCVMVPTSHDYQRIEQDGKSTTCFSLGTEYPRFSPFIYSLQLAIPVIELQQVKAWTPSPRGDWSNHREDWLILIWMRFQIVLGWILTSVSVGAVLTGIIRKD